MELISKQAVINKILSQPQELHPPSWYAIQIKALDSISIDEKIDQAYEDGYETGYLQAKFDYEQEREELRQEQEQEEIKMVGEPTGIGEPTGTFQIVAYEEYFFIVVDKKTRVMYAVSNGMYNKGTLTLLVNASGRPRLWEGKIVEWK